MPTRSAKVPLRGADSRQPTPVNDGIQSLTHGKVRTLMDVAKSLRHLGIEASDLPIPKICVVGDQSTGKSSVIESISEIRTPRSAGTCTRCPIEINLSEADEASGWRCNVMLTLKYTFDSKAKKSATRLAPLGPWIEKELDVVDFATLRQKEDVLAVLKLAQLALLNPSLSPDKFRPGQSTPASDLFQVPFSPNGVRLDISAPSVPNLSFYDLPGVISQDSEEYVPKLITNLVKDYIRPENCIILQTLTMNYDVANSNAGRIIKDAHAQSRTVGVLTKPDLFLNDALHEWLAILDGKNFALERGYYVVKNNPDPDVTHAVARKEEEHFFKAHAPFNTQLSHHQSKFGTLKLQKALSEMLAVEIERSLPLIIHKIKEKLHHNEAALACLPKPLEGNISLQVQHKISLFEQKLIKELDGGALECEFFEAWHSAARRFRNYLVCSYPLLKFAPAISTPRSCSTMNSNGNSISPKPTRPVEIDIVDSDDEPSPSKRTKMSAAHGPSSRKRDSEALAKGTEARLTFEDQLSKLEGIEIAREKSKRFTMDEITQYLNRLHTGLPGSRNQEIVKRMHMQATEHWPIFYRELMEKTSALCEELSRQCISSTFQQWSTTPLCRTIEHITNEFHLEVLNKQLKSVEAMYSLERSRVMTFSEDEMRQHESDITAVLGHQSRRLRQQTYYARRGMSEEQVSKADADRVKREIAAESEPFALQIQEMATVRAYYHVSARRFTDHVGLEIVASLFAHIKDRLPRELEAGLGLNQEDANRRCKHLLEVDPSVAEERERLLREQDTLRKAQTTLTAQLRDGKARFGVMAEDVMI